MPAFERELQAHDEVVLCDMVIAAGARATATNATRDYDQLD
jgi:hypothetical protein